MESSIIILVLFCSAFIPGCLLLFLKKDVSKFLNLFLAFGGAYLLGLIFLHLLPEIFHTADHKIGYFILAGFLIQLFLEFLSQGLEHGHVHTHNHGESGFKVPIAMFIGLAIHALIEGLPLGASNVLVDGVSHNGHSHAGETLLLGIAMHKIPVSIVLTTLFLSAKWSRTKVVVGLLVFAIMSPIGVLLFPYANEQFMAEGASFFSISLALLVGILLHISTTILFENGEGHKFNLKKLLVALAGFALVMLTL